MSYRKSVILILLILLAGWVPLPALAAESYQEREQQIKAAFLYNFINFVKWPEEKMPDNDEPIVIGVIGNSDFIEAFDPIKDKTVQGKKILLKDFKDLDVTNKTGNKRNVNSRQKSELESLKKCHILFICNRSAEASEALTTIMNAMDKASVLIVGEQDNFLEKGGTINFLLDNKKLRFEINLHAAEQNKLEIRSKLLKLAKRVITEKHEGDAAS